VRATSVFAPTEFAEVTDTVGAASAPFTVLYLPWIDE
jgi:hypothetical protein